MNREGAGSSSRKAFSVNLAELLAEADPGKPGCDCFLALANEAGAESRITQTTNRLLDEIIVGVGQERVAVWFQIQALAPHGCLNYRASQGVGFDDFQPGAAGNG